MCERGGCGAGWALLVRSGWASGLTGLVGGSRAGSRAPPQPPTCPHLLQIVAALDANPTTKRTQLQHKFEQVIALMEDNIYECCSEA